MSRGLHRAHRHIDCDIALVAILNTSGVIAPLNHTAGSHTAVNASRNGNMRKTNFSPPKSWPIP